RDVHRVRRQVVAEQPGLVVVDVLRGEEVVRRLHRTAPDGGQRAVLLRPAGRPHGDVRGAVQRIGHGRHATGRAPGTDSGFPAGRQGGRGAPRLSGRAAGACSSSRRSRTRPAEPCGVRLDDDLASEAAHLDAGGGSPAGPPGSGEGRGKVRTRESARAASVSPLKITEAALALGTACDSSPLESRPSKAREAREGYFSLALVHRLPTETSPNNPPSQEIT